MRATLPKTKHESSLKILAVGSEIYNSDNFHKKLRARTQFREISVHPTEPNLKKINYEWGKKEIFRDSFDGVGVAGMIINYTLKVVVKLAINHWLRQTWRTPQIFNKATRLIDRN